jgi:UDP-N-acetylglucosamine acyltransferase
MNSIHPSAIVAEDVQLGTGNTIGPHVVITGPVTIGDDNWIGTGVVIGAPPEVRSWDHPRDALLRSSGNGIEIGNRNTLREYAQVHQGWHAKTILGNDIFLMNQVYVAHDSTIEDGVTLASSVLLAGHVRLGAGSNLGLGAVIHQRRFVGAGAMVGMGSVLTRDVPPFAKSYGNPARIHGANVIGMQRRGIPDQLIAELNEQYNASGLDLEALRHLEFRDELRQHFSAWLDHQSAQSEE